MPEPDRLSVAPSGTYAAHPESAADLSDRTDSAPLARKPRPRWWAPVGVLAVVGFIALLVISTRSASVPVGASGSAGMSMSMSAGRLMLRMTDFDGRRLWVPAGRPGAFVFAMARGCGVCLRAAQTAVAAMRRAGVRAQLVVVMVDASTVRDDVAAFARALGHSAARFVVDDRSNTIASAVGASGLGAIVVYDARGRVIARPAASAAALSAALRRAARNRPGSPAAANSLPDD